MNLRHYNVRILVGEGAVGWSTSIDVIAAADAETYDLIALAEVKLSRLTLLCVPPGTRRYKVELLGSPWTTAE